MQDRSSLPADVQRTLGLLTDGVHEILRRAFVSLFAYGALAFPHPDGWRADLDFHVLVERPLTQDEQAAVNTLHADIGHDLDGYYITLDDARRAEPPPHQLDTRRRDEAWALHRAHVLAGRYFVIFGVDPRDIIPSATLTELQAALRHELRFVEAHPDDAAFGILNAVRILYSVEHRDVVVSKYAAAQWARDRFPQEECAAVDAAARAYVNEGRRRDDLLLSDGWSAVVARARSALAQAERP